MAIGRVANLLDFQLSLGLYKGFARIHLFCRTWTEFLFPFSVLQSVEVAHPNHTIKAFETSYTTCLKQLGETNLDTTGEPLKARCSEFVQLDVGPLSKHQDVPDDEQALSQEILSDDESQYTELGR